MTAGAKIIILQHFQSNDDSPSDTKFANQPADVVFLRVVVAAVMIIITLIFELFKYCYSYKLRVGTIFVHSLKQYFYQQLVTHC